MERSLKNIIVQCLQREITRRQRQDEFWLGEFVCLPDAERQPIIAEWLRAASEELVAQRGALPLRKIEQEREIDTIVHGIAEMLEQWPDPVESRAGRRRRDRENGRQEHTETA